MSDKYDETKVKPTTSTSQDEKRINESKVQNILSKRRYDINFDDKKYAVKTVKTRFSEIEQQPSKSRGLLESILVIGRFLAKIFTSEKETYNKLQLQIGRSSKTKEESHIDDKHTEEISSKLKKSNIEQVDDKKSRNP
ncbi:hypothetical protein GOY07_00060 [Wolbachia endosymbiont of Litomosoides sigmodontis]|uniref:hypothetical protein n=1 Tax=Wolbachia endosymbiont of Litomosoides sigmodontis TaxID=80850 RepID=UPI00158C30D7|nr:hypothetical protein [Wolbachia endosymbiont of Litomosoides sigmodontis]QKX02661.1 hypothetical protein GOY07_00060 [Wolbachia endosymbiont of Litomosoides sigmodontis]